MAETFTFGIDPYNPLNGCTEQAQVIGSEMNYACDIALYWIGKVLLAADCFPRSRQSMRRKEMFIQKS